MASCRADGQTSSLPSPAGSEGTETWVSGPSIPILPHLLPLSPSAPMCPGATSHVPRSHDSSHRGLYPWSLWLVFQQRVVTHPGQTKSAGQEDFLANGSVLGKRHRFPFVRSYLMGSLLPDSCPLPFRTFVPPPPLLSLFFSPLPPRLLHTCLPTYPLLLCSLYLSSPAVFPPLHPHTCPLPTHPW